MLNRRPCAKELLFSRSRRELLLDGEGEEHQKSAVQRKSARGLQ
jgi:hypothetical protein